VSIFSRLFESKESRHQRVEAQRLAEQAEVKQAAEAIHAKRLAEQAEAARRAEAMRNRKLNWTDDQMLRTLRRLCNAYAQDDTAAISKLEPLATQIGEDLNIVGGIKEMRRLWNKLDNMRGSRTLDMHWGGIGDWRG
jgi:sRNA-binding protein